MTNSTAPGHGERVILQGEVYGIEVRITEHADGTATLAWSDGVANDWSETYGDLSVTLLRYAALLRCGADDWEPTFVDDPDEFEVKARAALPTFDPDKADEFLRGAVSR